MNDHISSARELGGWSPPPPLSGGGNWGEGMRVVLYEGHNFSGRSYVITGNALRDLSSTGFDDRASSLRVLSKDTGCSAVTPTIMASA